MLPCFIMPTRAQQIAELEQRLADLQTRNRKRESQLRAKKGRLEAAERTRERKRDTRWKILIGGTVLARAASDPNAADRLDLMMDEVLTEDRDRHLLERWRGLRRSATVQQGSRHKKGLRSVHEHGPDRKVKS